MAPGEGLAPGQQERIATAIDRARTDHGLDVSVLVGDLALDDLSGFRAAAERLHAALGERSASAVLVVVAPGQRRVEVVTGPAVRRRVPDRVAALAVLSMTTAFTGGDIAGGVVDAVRQIADAAGRRPGLPPADFSRAALAARPDAQHGSSSAPAIGAGAH
ncbi:MAG TPA: TPM domain-containing protein [Mycobacteriales bacterium]|nr:TPM domain-containing protein [Mycobacteriales bacterium]